MNFFFQSALVERHRENQLNNSSIPNGDPGRVLKKNEQLGIFPQLLKCHVCTFSNGSHKKISRILNCVTQQQQKWLKCPKVYIQNYAFTIINHRDIGSFLNRNKSLNFSFQSVNWYMIFWLYYKCCQISPCTPRTKTTPNREIPHQ